jgi:hypothetical protein
VKDRSVVDVRIRISRKFVFWFVVVVVGLFALLLLWLGLQTVGGSGAPA